VPQSLGRIQLIKQSSNPQPGVGDDCQPARAVQIYVPEGKMMGANHAGEKKRKKAKITLKNAATQARKQAAEQAKPAK
jgi:hypothetical protein